MIIRIEIKDYKAFCDLIADATIVVVDSESEFYEDDGTHKETHECKLIIEGVIPKLGIIASYTKEIEIPNEIALSEDDQKFEEFEEKQRKLTIAELRYSSVIIQKKPIVYGRCMDLFGVVSSFVEGIQENLAEFSSGMGFPDKEELTD